MERDGSATAHLCNAIAQFYCRPNLAGGAKNHLPSQISDLSCPKARLRGKQHHNAIAFWISGGVSEKQKFFDLAGGQNLGLLATHVLDRRKRT
jgi:hypothetical protein